MLFYYLSKLYDPYCTCLYIHWAVCITNRVKKLMKLTCRNAFLVTTIAFLSYEVSFLWRHHARWIYPECWWWCVSVSNPLLFERIKVCLLVFLFFFVKTFLNIKKRKIVLPHLVNSRKMYEMTAINHSTSDTNVTLPR